MERRSFLKTALIGYSVGLLLLSTVTAAQAADRNYRRFTLTQTYNLVAPEGSAGVTKLWVPLPEEQEFQQILAISYEGNYSDAQITTNNEYGAKTLFVTWNDAENKPALKVTMDIATRDWEPGKSGALNSYRVPEKIIYPKEAEIYLRPTAHIPVDGIVKRTAEKIVGSETNPLKKARLIYDWVSANMERDNNVPGCGEGDVRKILESGKLTGKCTDINSVFVALARAVGIPAREMFGLRLGKSVKLHQYSATAFGSADEKRVSSVSGGQHCRAMFYLAGFGWVPADAADVAKMRLTENKPHSDPASQAVHEYLFGNWEMNWVGFNYGRDFTLWPEPEQSPLNNFGYPYAEVGGDPLDYYAPKTFSYDYSAQER
jgi:transglutaminase-like putative cysteine protease